MSWICVNRARTVLRQISLSRFQMDFFNGCVILISLSLVRGNSAEFDEHDPLRITNFLKLYSKHQLSSSVGVKRENIRRKLACARTCLETVYCSDFLFNKRTGECRTASSPISLPRNYTAGDWDSWNIIRRDKCLKYDGMIVWRVFGTCFRASNKTVEGLTEARAWCDARSGILAKISTENQREMMTSCIRQHTNSSSGYFISVFVESDTDTAKWDNNTRVETWHRNFASDSGLGHCVAIDPELDFKWKVVSCNSRLHVVCEIHNQDC